MHSEDGFIIQKCLNGEPEAFGLLVDKYKASIYAFVYAKLHNFHDAEDVTQETFIKAYQKLRDLRKWDSFLAWLYCIASDKCRKFVRSQSARPDREFIEDQNFKDNWIDTHSENAYDSLHDALGSLPDIYREVLTLHYLGGMNTNQIATFLRVSPEAIRQRLSRARTQLKEEVLAMMSGTLPQHRLQASFTFRVVEILKKIKIQPTSSIKGLPYGLSLGAGLIFAFLMFGQHIQVNLSNIAMGLPLPSEMKVLKVGEIPVEAVKVSTIASIGNKGDGKGIAPDPKDQENAFFMDPQGEAEWTKRADMPTARSALCTVVINEKIYAIGGVAGLVLSNVEEYDPIENKWEIRSSMPQAKRNLSASSVNGKIYAFGGWTDNNFNKSTSVYEYDPVLDKWTSKKDIPRPQVYDGVCSLNSKIYVFGGKNEANGRFINVYEYDPAEDSWTEKAKMLTERCYTSACPVNGKIYVIGGVLNGPVLSTVEEYDPVADTWEKKSDMPTARAFLAACAVGTKIYAIGGNNLPNGQNAGLTTVEIYDTLTDTWTKGVDMQTPRWLFSASIVGGKIYSIGGFSGNGLGGNSLSVVEEFDADFISKSVDPNGKLPKTWGMLKAK
jgi:RNA polymerase sigma factor (sigma-70 family)